MGGEGDKNPPPPVKGPAAEIIKKFAEQKATAQSYQRQIAQCQRKNDQLAEEVAALQAELNKGMEMKERMEGLARDLKKKKDEVYDDLRKKDAADMEARNELTQKFQGTIADLSARMEAEAEQQYSIVNENKKLRTRLLNSTQQIEIRLQQCDQTLKTKDVELRLVDAKMDHLQELAKSDRVRSEVLRKQLESGLKRQEELSAQRDKLQEKFDGLQQTMAKSNDVFKNYRGELDKMAKKTKQLESEKKELMRKLATKTRSCATAKEEVEQLEKKHDQLTKTGETLQGLVRTLQQERDDFMAWKKECPEQYKAALESAGTA